MLEAKWYGSHAVVVNDGVVELIWPRESGMPPSELGPMVERAYSEPLL
jgi:hypothetical protein